MREGREAGRHYGCTGSALGTALRFPHLATVPTGLPPNGSSHVRARVEVRSQREAWTIDEPSTKPPAAETSHFRLPAASDSLPAAFISQVGSESACACVCARVCVRACACTKVLQRSRIREQSSDLLVVAHEPISGYRAGSRSGTPTLRMRRSRLATHCRAL